MLSLVRKKAGFKDMGFEVDSHCHLLPGVDDGVQTFEESVHILEDMAAAGMTGVILTPHVNRELFPQNNEQFLKQRYQAFTAELPVSIKERLSLKLGAEYMVTEGFEDRNPDELLQFKEGKVLIEMSYMYPSRNMESSIFKLSMAGLTPVIAHPERYLYLANDLDRFEHFHDMGAEYQLNAFSLTGAYGPASERILQHLLKKGLYSHIGSDTHSVKHFQRILGMSYNQRYLPLI